MTECWKSKKEMIYRHCNLLLVRTILTLINGECALDSINA